MMELRDKKWSHLYLLGEWESWIWNAQPVDQNVFCCLQWRSNFLYAFITWTKDKEHDHDFLSK